ncbi:dihydrolipoamide acetyltransferase family protein [Microbacterium xanthum]|uniref:dihydrolipoamide acetyltransferase family protein n=1 Tax=Microbacterium xanthum TaxID=3079794 RepID=UPI002AD4639C|nr:MULTISPECIES: dihydrolipoamide acetyltransferase family protein [unclassified Microbacterium]MDZ8170809.1 dihydrolipoamide acetyltransferase family protein [Microbacterium sp. KSW-48]MDZ8201318.1 dihydrolipoamide acetyltransferase family protein [Microbacterium sp. SSW1-59]
MASALRMPGVSADSEEAVLVEWSVSSGASIGEGDALAVVETEKANVDIVADAAGTVWRLLAEPGESVVVGNPIAVVLAAGEGDDAGEALLTSLGLGDGDDAGSDSEASDPERAPAPERALDTAPAGEPAAAAASSAVAPSPAGEGRRLFASPLVRRLAHDAGVSLESVPGSGPHGRVVKRDLEKVLAAPETSLPSTPPPAAPTPASAPVTEATPAAEGDIPHTRMRRAIATALAASKQQSPHFYLSRSVRMDALLDLRETINAASTTRVSVNDFIVKAIAEAFVSVPEANVMWLPDAVRPLPSIDVSVAIGSEKGLVTPVVRDVDRLRLTEVSKRVRDYVARADEGRLRQEDLEGGSFTVSNLGMFGVEEFSAIINPPQVGILAVGAIVETPVVEDGGIVPARVMKVTASFDHRPIDGVLGARWLAAFAAALENPYTLLA